MNAPTDPSNRPVKYLTTVIGGAAYGIPVLKVREIIQPQSITPIPNAPDFVRGVINLRGRVIPILDLRLRFAQAANFTDLTCIVVVDVKQGPERHVPMGFMVDAVEEVVSLIATDIEPPPKYGVCVDLSHVTGMANVNGTIKTLLELDHLVFPGTVAQLFPAG